MLGDCHLDLVVSGVDHEGAEIPHRGTHVNEAILDVVVASTSRADYFLTKESSRGKVGEIEATETSNGVVLIVIFA